MCLAKAWVDDYYNENSTLRPVDLLMKTILIAIGGNALFDSENGNNIDPRQLQLICDELVKVVKLGYQPLLTFGNGPQVGNLLEMTERYIAPPKWPIPLDVCVAWTQAEIGYQLGKALYNALLQAGIERSIMAVNTTIVVDSEDPAFINATKPVGNFFSEKDAQVLEEERGWEMKQDSNRGWRRVVPSPRPMRVLEEQAIASLVQGGSIILCGGGGGIPVAEEEGELRGVEAVIDKDYTACLIASRLNIEELVICTGVENVYLHFGTPEQVALGQVTLAEAKKHLAEGQFPPGSMGPKVEALVQFIEQGGKRATMTLLEKLSEALQDRTGTRFIH